MSCLRLISHNPFLGVDVPDIGHVPLATEPGEYVRIGVRKALRSIEFEDVLVRTDISALSKVLAYQEAGFILAYDDECEDIICSREEMRICPRCRNRLYGGC